MSTERDPRTARSRRTDAETDAEAGVAVSDSGTPARHTAGAFDIRNIIGALLAAYGVILTGMGVFADQQAAKTGGINANLWAGLGLLVLGVGFMAWARLRPVVVDEAELARAHAEQGDRPPGH